MQYKWVLTSSAIDDGFAPDRVKEDFEDTKGVIRIRKSNNTMAKRKRTYDDLQNIYIKRKIE